jgi:hypothetical protein
MILGTVFFGSDRILAFRPRWFDLPMLAWCFCGLVTSLQNDLGVYDGLSDVLRQFLAWGLPYLLGRLYFNDAEGLRSFTVAMVIGGLAYVLPCLWEMKMSPQLMGNVYGLTGWQGTRLGGYRPHVFFKTGLELGMWMTAASLTGWWLWRCGVLKKLGSVSFGRVWLPILLGTTVLCRSTGALVLLAGGMIVLWASARFMTRAFLVALVLVGPTYVALRTPRLWSGQQLVELAQNFIDSERAQSLGYRFMCEDLLVTKALQRPVFGWGGWNRSAVYFDDNYRDGNHVVPPDGLWIAVLGGKGWVGLSLVYLALGLPTILFLWRFPARLWHHPLVASATLAAVLLGLSMIDFLGNGFINIIYITLAGGLINITPAKLKLGLGEGGTSGGEVAMADRFRTSGRLAKEQGKLEEAQVAWQHALKILTRLVARHSNTPDLLHRWCDCANDLAWLQLNYLEQTAGSLASTLALARQAAERRSNCAVYWNTLGVACFRAEDFHGAVTALNRSMALSAGGSPFDHIFLAMAHAKLGNPQQAQHWLAQVVSRTENDYLDHPELTRFCDEARSILAEDFEASATPVRPGTSLMLRRTPAETS